MREGVRVVIGDINEAAGADLGRELGESALFIHCDLTSETSVPSLMDSGTDWLGGLDGVCQNAGLQFAAMVPDLSLEL